MTESIIKNGERAEILVHDIFHGMAGRKPAKEHDNIRVGAEFEVAFRPLMPRARPESAKSMKMDGKDYEIVEIGRSAVTRGFYVALVREAK